MAGLDIIYAAALWTREGGEYPSRSFFIFFLAIHAKQDGGNLKDPPRHYWKYHPTHSSPSHSSCPSAGLPSAARPSARTAARDRRFSAPLGFAWTRSRRGG